MTLLKPKLVECEIGHALIMYSEKTSCPLCVVRRYLDVVVMRLNESKSMADYLLSLLVVMK